MSRLDQPVHEAGGTRCGKGAEHRLRLGGDESRYEHLRSADSASASGIGGQPRRCRVRPSAMLLRIEATSCDLPVA